MNYIVPGIIPEGTTMFAGPPKIGKSWLALDIALAVARGGYVLGDIKCEQGDVLYLALEDNQRRLQDRVRKISQGDYVDHWPESFHYALQSAKANDGGLRHIEKWINAVANPRLVVIDVLAAFRSSEGASQNLYQADYAAIKAVQELNSRYPKVGIIVVHHTRKAGSDVDPFECVSGTNGINGAADASITLMRTGGGVVTLYGRGRDIAEFEKAVTFNKESCRWTIQGEVQDVKRSSQQRAIIDALFESPDPLSPKELTEITGNKSANIRQMLQRMCADGSVVRTDHAKYTLPNRSHGVSDHNDHNVTSERDPEWLF